MAFCFINSTLQAQRGFIKSHTDSMTLLPFGYLFSDIRPGYNKEPSDDSFSEQGMATVEASIVIPLFLIFCVFMIELSMMLMVETEIYDAFSEAVTSSASEAYAAGALKGSGEDIGVYAAISLKLRSELSKLGDINSFVVGGKSGVLLKKAKLGEDGIIEASLYYRVKPRLAFFKLSSKGVEEKLFQKAYTGYVKNVDEEASEYVYITETGRVYHKSRSCYHINLKINRVTSSRLPACRYCGRKDSEVKYVGEAGDCYHSSLFCPAIKRTVMRVKKSDLTGYAPCSNCGG